MFRSIYIYTYLCIYTKYIHLFIARYKQIGEKNKQTSTLLRKSMCQLLRPGLSSSFDLSDIYFLALNILSMHIRVSSGSKLFRKNCAKMLKFTCVFRRLFHQIYSVQLPQNRLT